MKVDEVVLWVLGDKSRLKKDQKRKRGKAKYLRVWKASE
jgi:hypothetical protein